MLFSQEEVISVSGISIIICSRNGSMSKNLVRNIKNSIGIEYEIIVIDNSENEYSIFQAYNLGLDRSSKDMVCFLHEDVLIHTQNWGRILQGIFLSDPLAGLIGVAGGRIKCSMPSAWWDAGKNAVHIIQHFNHKPKKLYKSGFDNLDNTEVAAIDGVFMVMLRNNKVRFDERLKGFHNYDLYLALHHHKIKKKVLVTDKILIEHFSHGNLNKAWYKSTSLFHKLFRNSMPIVSGDFCESILNKKEITVGFRFITGLVENKLYIDAIYWWYRMFKLAPFSKYHMKFLLNLILRK